MKAKLFHISKDYKDIIEKIQDNDGVIEPELLHKLEEIETIAEKKVDNYIQLKKHIVNENDLIDNEIKRLQKRKKVNNNIIDFLDFSLLSFLNDINEKSYKTALFTISSRVNYSTIISNEELIPEDFKEKEIIIKCNKNAIKTLLQRGNSIPGAELKITKSIIIK